jgi:hypothetical protein
LLLDFPITNAAELLLADTLSDKPRFLVPHTLDPYEKDVRVARAAVPIMAEALGDGSAGASHTSAAC